MKEYLWGLVVLAVVCGVCGLVCPGGEKGTYGQQMRLLTGVCLALYLIRPVISVAQGGLDAVGFISDFFDEISQGNDSSGQDGDDEQEQNHMYAQMDVALAVFAIREKMCRELALNENDTTIGICLNDTGERIVLVRVGLSGTAIWKDSHAMEDWIRSNVGCDAEIYVK
jgi:hypothetical protein